MAGSPTLHLLRELPGCFRVAARKEGTSAGLKITLPQLGDKSVELSGNSIENGNSEDLVPALPLISCLTLSNSFAFS